MAIDSDTLLRGEAKQTFFLAEIQSLALQVSNFKSETFLEVVLTRLTSCHHYDELKIKIF